MKSLSPFASFALRFITLLTIIAAPWYLGGVTHGVHAAACLAGFAGLLLLLLLTRSPQSVFRVSPVELVLALTPILLVSLQLVPLPEEVLRFVAPAAANLRAQYSLAEVAPATISLAPAETRLFLSRCWLGIVFFLIGKWLGAFESKKFLLWTFVANGIVLAFFGIAHRLGGPHDLFWENTDPLRDGFGPFVNKNNAAGYLCATLAIAAWMIVVPKSDSLEYSDKTQSTAAVRSARFAMWIINMLVVSLLLTGVLFTLSRSAYIAVFFGFLAIIPIIARNLRQLTLIGTGLAFTALLLVWSGFQSGILERFRKIDSSELQMMRGLHWQDDVIMASDMWLGGCGMGAYRFVNRVYQTVPTDLWFMYSENQYLETLVSGGIFMLTALLVAIVLFLWRSWQLGAQHFDPTAKSIGVLGISLVVMQIVTASFDFALFHSSNLILVACLAGIVLGTQQKNAAIINGSTRITTMALVLLLSIGLFSTRESLAHANIESAMGGNAYRTIVGDGQRPESMGRLIRDIDGLKSALKY